MTNDRIYSEIDCSKTYANDQSFLIVAAPFNMFRIKLSKNGTLPGELDSHYTSTIKAEQAVNIFLAGREAHFDHIERKNSAKRAEVS